MSNLSDGSSWPADSLSTPVPQNQWVHNCWAPEIFYDEATKQYLIFWASTIEGRFPETAGSCESKLNHRMYYVTTKDFEKPVEVWLARFDPRCVDGLFNAHCIAGQHVGAARTFADAGKTIADQLRLTLLPRLLQRFGTPGTEFAFFQVTP